MVTLGLALGILMSVARAQKPGARQGPWCRCSALCRFLPGDAPSGGAGLGQYHLPRGCPEVTNPGLCCRSTRRCSPWRQSSSSKTSNDKFVFNLLAFKRAGDLDQRDLAESRASTLQASNPSKTRA